MKIALAFVHSGPGRGLIRARVNDGKPLTVGRYQESANGAKWTARLYAEPGRHMTIAQEITATELFRLRGAVSRQLAQGMWWR